MELEEVQKAVSDFEAKLAPVTPEMKAMAAGVEVGEEIPATLGEPVPAGVAAEGEACITKDFKKIVGVLPDTYIGSSPDIKDLVVGLLESLPECKE